MTKQDLKRVSSAPFSGIIHTPAISLALRGKGICHAYLTNIHSNILL